MYDELTEAAVPQIWAGVDIGKEHHHCVVIDAQGTRLLSRRVLNDETELLQLLADVMEFCRGMCCGRWTSTTVAALLLGLLVSHDQHITYITGLAVHRASAGYQTPAAIRRAGTSRVTTWLKNRKVYGSAALATAVMKAAEAQFTALPGERLAAIMVARLAKGVMALDEEIAELEALIEARFREHPSAEVIQSMPGMGTMLSAEFLAATGGDMDAFGTADRLAGYAGLAPVPRDSGRVSGPPPAPLPPRLAPRLLPLRLRQPAELPSLETVLRTQAGRGQGAQAGAAGARPSPGQRLVGHDPRWSVLPSHTTSHGSGLTASLGSSFTVAALSLSVWRGRPW